MYITLLFYKHWAGRLEAERKKAKAKMMYKLLNNMGPQSLTYLFTYKDEVTSYNLRNISTYFHVRRSISLEFHSKGY